MCPDMIHTDPNRLTLGRFPWSVNSRFAVFFASFSVPKKMYSCLRSCGDVSFHAGSLPLLYSPPSIDGFDFISHPRHSYQHVSFHCARRITTPFYAGRACTSHTTLSSPGIRILISCTILLVLSYYIPPFSTRFVARLSAVARSVTSGYLSTAALCALDNE